MNKHKQHTVVAAIVMLVLGGIAVRMTGTDAVSLASNEPAAGVTISPLDLMQRAHRLPVQTVADPI